MAGFSVHSAWGEPYRGYRWQGLVPRGTPLLKHDKKPSKNAKKLKAPLCSTCREICVARLFNGLPQRLLRDRFLIFVLNAEISSLRVDRTGGSIERKFLDQEIPCGSRNVTPTWNPSKPNEPCLTRSPFNALSLSLNAMTTTAKDATVTKYQMLNVAMFCEFILAKRGPRRDKEGALKGR